MGGWKETGRTRMTTFDGVGGGWGEEKKEGKGNNNQRFVQFLLA